jgi:D-arabinose 5-phosphate isomerase GutQ
MVDGRGRSQRAERPLRKGKDAAKAARRSRCLCFGKRWCQRRSPSRRNLAELILNARQRDLYGIGGSAQIARDVSHKLLRIGVRTSVFDDAHMILMSAALLSDGDVAIAFFHSVTTTAVIEPLELARKNGARIIGLTSYAGSPNGC